MLILSVHLCHDASICLLEDGHLKKYFLVERFTRKKHDDDDKVILDLVSGVASKLKKKLNGRMNKCARKKFLAVSALYSLADRQSLSTMLVCIIVLCHTATV